MRVFRVGVRIKMAYWEQVYLGLLEENECACGN
jgi:hypothetical protein